MDWAGVDEVAEAPVGRDALERVVVPSVSTATMDEKVWVELEKPPAWDEVGAAVALAVPFPAAVALALADADAEPPV